MAVIDYADGFTKNDNTDILERQKKDFENEYVEFSNMPADAFGWKQNVKLKMEGHTAIKTVTRTCWMKDGS